MAKYSSSTHFLSKIIKIWRSLGWLLRLTNSKNSLNNMITLTPPDHISSTRREMVWWSRLNSFSRTITYTKYSQTFEHPVNLLKPPDVDPESHNLPNYVTQAEYTWLELRKWSSTDIDITMTYHLSYLKICGYHIPTFTSKTLFSVRFLKEAVRARI